MRDLQKGFTVIELVIVIAVVGVLSAYAVMKSVSPAELTLPSQAETMASNIRHAQTLASTWGKRMRVDIGSGSYSVTCDAGPAATPCTTNNNFTVPVEKSVAVAGSTTYFNSLGQPSDYQSVPLGSASAPKFSLTSGNSKKTVCVAPLTGFVRVFSGASSSVVTCP